MTWYIPADTRLWVRGQLCWEMGAWCTQAAQHAWFEFWGQFWQYWALKQLAGSDRDIATLWEQNTTESLWGCLGSKASHRLIQKNSTPYIMALNTQFSYLGTSQRFPGKCSPCQTNISDILRESNDTKRPRATGIRQYAGFKCNSEKGASTKSPLRQP